MEKFMLIFHSFAASAEAFNNPSPEAMQAELQKWNHWIGGIAAQGRLAGTEALQPTGRTLTGPERLVTDGPYTEGKEIVGGYLFVMAADLDEAARLAEGCPVFEHHGSVEIRPLMVMA